ncbi:MAG: endonuclease III [Pelagibacteraceae bacterium]|jgi:endonuclease-3|nr:endonuclease III [Pelagibacteraceae bacterium]MBT3901329.1 endonuclease III [Pelagibacteraceae bacterium]MBT4646470.1 endonuclease III [Pelagibacteraceae bacterium]MBT4951065.1 endonuclease III [Pelagibacteraceae bacterium]MBT5214249.1 endonuclease III [Pelagibacteraceae bacterium]
MDKSSINSVYRILAKKIGEPKTELNYRNPFTFLVSVVLSAQATDKSVNAATKDLFKIVKNPKDMVALGERKLKGYIKTIGLYNSKAKNIINLSKILINDFKNKIPTEFKDLTSLPGVGNKTASVYQNEILNIPRIAVDTHVYRVSNRVGLVKTKTADQTQEILEQITPKKWLKTAHHLLILHGRYTCKSQKPMCDQCAITKHCFYLKNEKN